MFLSYYAMKEHGKDMLCTADPRVDAYIDALPGWQQAICRHVRNLVHCAIPYAAGSVPVLSFSRAYSHGQCSGSAGQH
jgi:hypothetical protein